MMKIAKEFRWEMGHRLPFHKGKCKNLHGHSYKAMIEFTGDVDENGMVLDYYDVKEVAAPIFEELDHAFMVYQEDKELLEVLDKLNSKKVVVNFQTTAENICVYLLNRIKKAELPSSVKEVTIWVYETETTYAMDSISL